MKAIFEDNLDKLPTLPKMGRNMATKEQIEAVKIDENVFEQREDTEQDLKCYEGEPTTNRAGPIFII